MTTDESVPPARLMDIWVAAGPDSWDPNGSTGGAGDDPTTLIEAAAASEGYLSEHLAQDHNGQDH